MKRVWSCQDREAVLAALRRGERPDLAKKGIGRLRRQYRRELGAAPVVVYVVGCYAVLAVEELLAALGRPVQESLLPFGGQKQTADSPDPRPPSEKPP